jgi:hypothetical protein
MQFKKGLCWKACYDEERELYTAERHWRGFYQLSVIDRESFEQMDDETADRLIQNGRHLVESDDDYYTMPYITVFDEDYDRLAPWSDARRRVEAFGTKTSRELTDLAVEIFPDEEKNREYRKKKEEKE